jgi:hypothetical protein
MLYEPNIKLSDLTFEDLFYRMKPRIEMHCRTNLNLVKGYDFDDLFQELSYKLWKVKIPDDLIYYDLRFIKYLDKCFRFHLYDLSKKKATKNHRKEEAMSIIGDILDNDDLFYNNFR